MMPKCNCYDPTNTNQECPVHRWDESRRNREAQGRMKFQDAELTSLKEEKEELVRAIHSWQGQCADSAILREKQIEETVELRKKYHARMDQIDGLGGYLVGIDFPFEGDSTTTEKAVFVMKAQVEEIERLERVIKYAIKHEIDLSTHLPGCSCPLCKHLDSISEAARNAKERE